MTDTIFALATAPGRAAVAVVRISGPGSVAALMALTDRSVAPRRASVRTLSDASGEAIDTALVLRFAGPHSYTGEDCVELHLHGGRGVVDSVTQALLALGLRLAEPGEFTRRAFENGKLDLDQAEAVADLVDAETANQTRQALGQLAGALGVRYRSWRDRLIDALARLEAAVDFPDEEIPADVGGQVRAALSALADEIDAAVDDASRGQRVREGYRIAVIGAPNSGKSSLINALSGRDMAIVTPTPGTTRDVIEAHLSLDGFSVVAADTAGLRETADPIEGEGVRRARRWAAEADLRLWVVDGSASNSAWRQALADVRPGDICVLNKSDLPRGADASAAERAAMDAAVEVINLSIARQGAGPLMAALSRRLRSDLTGAEFPAATRTRHAALLREASEQLHGALQAGVEPELAAENIRLAARALARISGRIDAEDILGRLFATFCIGK